MCYLEKHVARELGKQMTWKNSNKTQLMQLPPLLSLYEKKNCLTGHRVSGDLILWGLGVAKNC